MSSHSNTITLNGKVYDSVTGRSVGSSRALPAGANPFIISPDIVRSVSASLTPAALTPTAKASKSHKGHPVHHTHRATQHSQTLMRQAAKKPHHTAHSSAVRGQPAAKHQIDSDHTLRPIQSSSERAKRAAAVPKSSLISRFSYKDNLPPTLVKRTAVVPVKTAPATHVAKQIHHAPATRATQSIDDIFNQALSRATGHLETSPQSANHSSGKKLRLAARRVNLVAGVAIVVVMAGFIFYQNMANISVKVAAQRAGINAQLPGYRPAGFALSHTVKSYPGEVVLSFHSTSDNRNFTITQASSNWDSNTLLSEYVNTTDQHYKKLDQGNGQTVYLYGDANATWVDGGIWYRVQGNSSLSSNQLLKIVNGF